MIDMNSKNDTKNENTGLFTKKHAYKPLVVIRIE